MHLSTKRLQAPCAVLTSLDRHDNLACVMPGSPLKAQGGRA
jgi:hypothetical protein